MSINVTHIETPTKNITQTLLQLLGGALFIALFAQIKIPLPFTPVPLTLQTLAIMIIGGILGPKRSALATIAYLGLSLVGFPVIAGGVIEPLATFGLRGGYLLGFIGLAYFSGKIFEHKLSFWKTVPLLFLATLSLLCIGALWLSFFVGFNNSLIMGILPFIPGEGLKTFIATSIVRKVY